MLAERARYADMADAEAGREKGEFGGTWEDEPWAGKNTGVRGGGSGGKPLPPEFIANVLAGIDPRRAKRDDESRTTGDTSDPFIALTAFIARAERWTLGHTTLLLDSPCTPLANSTTAVESSSMSHTRPELHTSSSASSSPIQLLLL